MRYFVARGEDTVLDAALRASARGSFAKTALGLTQYELAGPEGGELVLLVGGLTVPLMYWDRFAAALHGHGYRTLAYSAYGRGHSDRVFARYDEALFVDQLRDLLDTLDLSPAHVVGSSLGAVVAMAYSLTAPAHLRSLTILGPAGLLPRAPRVASALAVPAIGPALGAAAGSRMLRRHLSHNVSESSSAADLRAIVAPCFRIRGSMYALASTLVGFPLANRDSLYREVRATGVRTLLVWGEDDQVTPATRWGHAVHLLSPTHATLLPNTGHMVSFERPAMVAELFHESLV